MADLYRRLYKYRERASNAPLENFLTEALADILERLPFEGQIAFLKSLMLPKAGGAFDSALAGCRSLEFATQASASTKRPDLVVYAGDRAVFVIEVKVAAGLQEHEVEATAVDAEAKTTRNQLETYAAWIAGENLSSDAWPGAVVFLTGRTDPPDDFIEGRADGVFRSVRQWKHVGDWLLTIARAQPRGLTHRDLATEMYQFLKEKGLMTKYVSSHDLAAAMLFVSSSSTLRKTFIDLIGSVAKAFPKLRGGRQLRSEFWSEGNVYWGWFHFAQTVKRTASKPYVAVGICFEIPAAYAADSASLPAHEPFFLVLCGDDWFTEKPDVFLTATPEGWVTIEEGQTILAVRPVRQFPADPDERFEAVKNWAASEVAKLVACIPGYADAATESAPAAEEDA